MSQALLDPGIQKNLGQDRLQRIATIRLAHRGPQAGVLADSHVLRPRVARRRIERVFEKLRRKFEDQFLAQEKAEKDAEKNGKSVGQRGERRPGIGRRQRLSSLGQGEEKVAGMEPKSLGSGSNPSLGRAYTELSTTVTAST